MKLPIIVLASLFMALPLLADVNVEQKMPSSKESIQPDSVANSEKSEPSQPTIISRAGHFLAGTGKLALCGIQLYGITGMFFFANYLIGEYKDRHKAEVDQSDEFLDSIYTSASIATLAMLYVTYISGKSSLKSFKEAFKNVKKQTESKEREKNESLQQNPSSLPA